MTIRGETCFGRYYRLNKHFGHFYEVMPKGRRARVGGDALSSVSADIIVRNSTPNINIFQLLVIQSRKPVDSPFSSLILFEPMACAANT
jgi:hypothetical protein